MATKDESISLEQRKAIFLALVEFQDSGETPKQSRTTVAKKFDIPESTVKEIEKEGEENEWPPL